MSTPVQEKTASTAIENSGESKKTPVSDKPDQRDGSDHRNPSKKNARSSQLKQFQPRLMLEENEEEKSVLIKIGMRTSTRQIINYALSKVRNDWKVTLNAFQMDMTKALQAAEIIKTRLPFLHQENKLQSYLATHKVETKDQPASEKKIIRTGIAISLSRNYFEVDDKAGYQKPKPRQFVQPLPRGGGRNAKDRVSSAPKDLRKRKNSNGKKKPEKRDHSSEEEEEEYEERKETKGSKSEFKLWGGSKKQDDDHVKPKKKNEKFVEKREKSPRHDRDEPKKGRRTNSGQRKDPREFQKRVDSGRNDHYRDERRGPPRDERRGPPRDDHRYKEVEYRQGSSGRYGNYKDPYAPPRHEGYRPRDFSEEERRRSNYDRFGPPRGGSRGGTRGRGVPFARGGGRPQFNDRERPQFNDRDRDENRGQWKNHHPKDDPSRDDFERPERPGYYSGNRQFRMDKTRDQPIEKLHDRAADQIEKERYERINKRDQRNRPSQEQFGHR